MDSATEGTDESDGFDWFLSRCFHDDYKTIPIREKCLTLGRGDNMGLQFCPKTYNYLSRNHCMVQILDGKPTITDCNSARGTFVNSKRLDKFTPGRIELKEGDHVGIGHKNDEIQQYFKFHVNILKYRVCRKIRDDEAIIVSDDESAANDTVTMATDTSSAESIENKISIPKATSPLPGPSGLQSSECVSIPIELLRNSSFEEEYDMCATRANDACYESDTEPCAPELINDEIIVLSDDDGDEYADLQHTQMILQEVKNELADIEKQATTHNIGDDTNLQWTFKLNSDVDATQRYKQSKERNTEDVSSKKEKVDNTASDKSSDKKVHQKSSKRSTDKENTKQSTGTKGKSSRDGLLKISLKRSSKDWVIANDDNGEAKTSQKSANTLATNDVAAEGTQKKTADEMVKVKDKSLAQEQPKHVRKRRHSVAGWNEIGAKQPNGTIEIVPPDNYQSAKGALPHRTPLWMSSSSADPKSSTDLSKPASVDPKPAVAECSRGAATDKDSVQNNSKPTLKRRGSIASMEEMQAMFQKKFKPRTNLPDKIFEFHPISAATKEQREQRKHRLNEVTMNKKNQEKTTAAMDDQVVVPKKTVSTKPKVKFTPNNRGMFLTAPIPPPPSRAASTSRPTSTDETIMCTQSTTLDQLPKADTAEEVIDSRPKKLTFESVARLSNVNRSVVPSGSGLQKITARRLSVNELPTSISRAQTNATDSSSTASNQNSAINSNSSAMTTNTAATNSTSSNVSKPSSVVAPYAPLVQRTPLRSILKTYNPNNRADRKSVVIMENLNKTQLVEKYIVPSPYAVREQILGHEQNLLAEILTWSPLWLIRQKSESSHSSPFVADDKMMRKLDDYEDYESFRKLHTPFLIRELWNEVSASSKSMSCLLVVRNALCRATKHAGLCEIECEVIFNGCAEQQSAAYDFGIMEYHISPHQKCSLFFYLHTQKPLVVETNGRDGGTSSHSTQAMKYILYASAAELKGLEMGRNFVLRPFTRIYLSLRRVNALSALKYSKLLCNILTPSFNVANILKVSKSTNPQSRTNCSTQPHLEPGTLNACQMKVLSSVLAECFCDELPTISIIQGPPGTGKSRVISHLVLELMRIARSNNTKMKVLVCAASNTAVDVIVKKVLNIKTRSAQTRSLKVVRTGSKNKVESSCMQVFIDKLIQDKMGLENGHDQHRHTNTSNYTRPVRTREEIKARIQILNDADIVCTTLGSCSMLASYSLDIRFDVCIIDEATQCTELCTLLPLQYNISKLVLVGDVHQLPATVLDQQSVEAGFRKSLFSRLYQSYVDKQKMDEMKVLTTQYRMCPAISSWPNEYFYQRQLKNAPCTESQPKDILLKPYMVVSVSYDQELTQAQYEIYNKDEIRFVVGLMKQMVTCCSKHASFAIITPYARHKKELMQTLQTLKLQRVEVHSIDSVQGKEYDVVVISLARSNGTGFLDQPERINVALTRARHCLVLCGNFTNLRRKPVWSSLLADAQKRKVYYQLEDHDAHAHGEQMVQNIMQRLRKD